MVSHVRRFDQSEIAKERFKIIDFYNTHGEPTTKEAFGVGRKTIHVWKKRLKTKGLPGLIPYSTAPKTTRCMQVNSKVFKFIKNLREDHPRLGKTKIKPILDVYCKNEDIPTISEAKIGRIIKKYNLFYQKTDRMYHNPSSKFATNRHKTKRFRVKYAPKPKDFGYVQIDTVVKLVDGVKYYFYCAIDTKGKFALSLPYKHLNSRNTVDFFKKFMFACPYNIKTVQTDNGLEFLGDFQKLLPTLNIKHFFTYPRCPRINGVVERYNRSFQEEFLNRNLHLIYHPKQFSSKLAQYLLFYNQQRVHLSLNNMTPLNYLIQEGGMSKMYRARTISRFKPLNRVKSKNLPAH